MRTQNITTPYDEIEYEGIQYCNCREYNHLCRHRGLRQVVHSPENIENRFISLENPNPYQFTQDSRSVKYHTVTTDEENRLDIIAKQYFGSEKYAWILAYYNNIEDGFTVRAGRKLVMPKDISVLFNNGQLLAPVSALTLNLCEE